MTEISDTAVPAAALDCVGLTATVSQLTGFNRSGVYFLYCKGVIVYVGQAVDVRRRIATHIGDGTKEFDAASFIPCSADRLLANEARYIRRLRPLYNRALNAASVAGITSYGSFAPSVPLTRSYIMAIEAAARLGIPVESVAHTWHAHGYRPRRINKSKSQGYCPIECDEIAALLGRGSHQKRNRA